jgi:hypothetical protein
VSAALQNQIDLVRNLIAAGACKLRPGTHFRRWAEVGGLVSGRVGLVSRPGRGAKIRSRGGSRWRSVDLGLLLGWSNDRRNVTRPLVRRASNSQSDRRGIDSPAGAGPTASVGGLVTLADHGAIPCDQQADEPSAAAINPFSVNGAVKQYRPFS